MKIFYIADLHFFHKNALAFDERPFSSLEEMHEKMVKKWNKKVAEEDQVYILGDVGLGGTKKEKEWLVGSLRGKKILVRGNHDKQNDVAYQNLFTKICDYEELTDVAWGKRYKLVLSHYPFYSWAGMQWGSILLYGHVHNGPEDVLYQADLRERNRVLGGVIYKKQLIAINVGCMKSWMDYEPRTLEEIIERKIIKDKKAGGKNDGSKNN